MLPGVLIWDDLYYWGKGEENSGGRKRDSILADVFESIIAAIYLDGGLDHARDFIIQIPGEMCVGSYAGQRFEGLQDHLQEILQQNSHDQIEYRIVKDSGPDHNKTFFAQVFHGNCLLGGDGKKQERG